MSRNRNFCFTLNNDGSTERYELDFAGLCDLMDNSAVKGGAFQEEMEAHLHFQGFIRMKNPQSMTFVIELFESYLGHRRTHLEVAGSPDKAVKYATAEFYEAWMKCVKDGRHTAGEVKRFTKDGVWEFGDLDFVQGKRSDLIECREVLENPEWKHATLYENHFASAVRYMQGFEKASFYIHKLRQVNREVQIHWLWGTTGLGKSRDARGTMTLADYYRLPTPNGGRLWFDGYEGEKVLIIEEFNTHTMSIEQLLELTDIYPLPCQIKGAFIWANWTKVVITSNFHYSELYPFATPIQKDCLARRVKYEKHYVAEQVIVRDPEDRQFFTLRNRISHTESHRDTPAGRNESGPSEVIHLDSGEDSDVEIGRLQKSTASRRRVLEDSPSCTPTQAVGEGAVLQETQLGCDDSLDSTEKDDGCETDEDRDFVESSQQHCFTFPGVEWSPQL